MFPDVEDFTLVLQRLGSDTSLTNVSRRQIAHSKLRCAPRAITSDALMLVLQSLQRSVLFSSLCHCEAISSMEFLSCWLSCIHLLAVPDFPPRGLGENHCSPRLRTSAYYSQTCE